MIKDIILPDLGEGIEGADVSEITVSVGDKVSPEDTIVVLESDKASMEIPAEVNGDILEVLISTGDQVNTGQILFKINISSDDLNESADVEKGEIEEPGEETEVLKPKELELKQPSVSLEETEEQVDVFASPGVRRLARELGIRLQTIHGSGQKGRITKDDLNGYIKQQMAMSSGSIVKPQKEIDFSQWGEVEVQKLTRINRVTGSRLQQAWQTIPRVTQYDKSDITTLESYRKERKTKAAELGVRVTFLPFLMKAVTVVLKEMPKFNSSLDHQGENLVLKHYYNIGVAVDTPNGLTVPVVKNVDQKSVFELSKELEDLSKRARDKKLKPNEMQGSTFTISSLGGIGGTAFSPIVNPPEVAILGISRSEWKQVYNKKEKRFLTKYVMPFSLSYDHRVIDGAAAAHFTSRFSAVLSDLSHFKT